MSKYFNNRFTAKVILVACFLALIDKRSNALFLGNFIGCNSFGCRIAALEQDVSQLKQQVMRLGGGGAGGMGGQFQQPNTMPYNPNQMMNQQGMNQQGMNPNQFNQNGQQQGLNQQGTQPQQQQQPATNNPTTRQTYGQYPDELRRVQGVPSYQNSLTNQFMSA